MNDNLISGGRGNYVFPALLVKSVMSACAMPRDAAKIAISYAAPSTAHLNDEERATYLHIPISKLLNFKINYADQIRHFNRFCAEHLLANALPAIAHTVARKAVEGSVSHARLAFEVDGAVARGYHARGDKEPERKLTVNVLIAQHFSDRFQQVDDGNGNKISGRVALPAGQREETPLDVKVEAEISQAKVGRHNARIEVSAGDD